MSIREVETVGHLPGVAPKKTYRKPVLTCHGDVRDLTLGPTRGSGESGSPTNFREATRSRHSRRLDNWTEP